jgi:hypothetical protein
MTRRALIAILMLVAGFVVSAPGQASAQPNTVAVSAQLEAVHLPGASPRSHASNTTPQQGLLGNAPVDLTPRAALPLPLRILLAVAERLPRLPESAGYTPLGERAPPLTSE